MKEWTEELRLLQELLPDETSMHRLQIREIPDLEKEIKGFEARKPTLQDEVAHAETQVNEMKRELRELTLLRQTAQLVTRTHRELEDLQRDVSALELELEKTGSTKSVEDVRAEVNEISDKM